jgi:hypothetical protein
MRTERRRQRDLFESDRPLPKIAPDLRAKIMALVQALLIEGTIGRATKVRDTIGGEACDDEDHR